MELGWEVAGTWGHAIFAHSTYLGILIWLLCCYFKAKQFNLLPVAMTIAFAANKPNISKADNPKVESKTINRLTKQHHVHSKDAVGIDILYCCCVGVKLPPG
eukprot:3425110-Amphidinium_carterae.1